MLCDVARHQSFHDDDCRRLYRWFKPGACSGIQLSSRADYLDSGCRIQVYYEMASDEPISNSGSSHFWLFSGRGVRCLISFLARRIFDSKRLGSVCCLSDHTFHNRFWNLS